MFNSLKQGVRKYVSGNRKRINKDGFDLDLTYITPRIIAMSFPSSSGSWQNWYRNDINQVATFIKQKHDNNFFIYNMSGIEYDSTPFDGQVITAAWKDHHSPTIPLLAQLCSQIYNYLQSDEKNVIIVHCNAGKGRTGTLICCYLMFCGFADTAQNAITYYGWKRFTHGRGVTQPSQVRYVFYFEQVLKETITKPRSFYLEKVYIGHLPEIKNNFRVQCQIFDSENYNIIAQNPENQIETMLAGDNIFIKFDDPIFINHGDIFVKLVHKGKSKDKLICRYGFHTSFLTKSQPQDLGDQYLKLDKYLMDPDSIHKNDNYPYPDFKIRMIFKNACKDEKCCQNSEEGLTYCGNCKTKLGKQIQDWEMIRTIVETRKLKKHNDSEFGSQQMFLSDMTDYEETINQGADVKIYGRFSQVENLNPDEKHDFDMKIYKQSSFKNKVDALKEAFGSDDDSEDEAKSDIPGEDALSEEPNEADMADIMTEINKMNKYAEKREEEKQ